MVTNTNIIWPPSIRPINDVVDIHVDRHWFDELQTRAHKNGPWDDWTMYQLAYEAEQTSIIKHFDELQCLAHLPMLEPLPHQLDAAKKVLTEMRGRAILADEVGLGKTIEAGLILKEYMLRGLVKKTLILVPASLVLQWVRELNQKFGIQAVAQKKPYMWSQYDCIVASMDTAKRSPHKEIIADIDYDMLIIDEAHKLKNKRTTNYQFIKNDVRKKYCLLLTATPVQNDMKELYNLINILKPGQLGGQNEYQSNYVGGKREPKNEAQLRQELSKVMIRNKRSEGAICFTSRIVKNITLELSEEEQALYDGVTSYVKKRAQEEGSLANALSLVTLQREVCSSRDAVFVTLVNMFKKTAEDSPLRAHIWQLVDQIKQIEANTKAEKVIELIQQSPEKAIIFTEYRATQQYLLHYLQEHGVAAVPYQGGMNRGKKDWMMDLFRRRAQVMIATEAGGEGINLQFCNRMINFDLPWNPMRVEQRIGRIHRLGQERDVEIYNLSTKGTIEEHILHLLHEKINMFERVIGGLDLILERLEQDDSIEKSLYKIVLEADDDQEIKQRLAHLSSSFNRIRSDVEAEEVHPYE